MDLVQEDQREIVSLIKKSSFPQFFWVNPKIGNNVCFCNNFNCLSIHFKVDNFSF
jgi:hypothetical protein